MTKFTAWGETLPATTPRPKPSEPFMVVHAYLDASMYFGTPAWKRWYAVREDEEASRIALTDLPLATVKFYQLPEDEPFFDAEDE